MPDGPIPTGITLRLVLSPEFVPILARDTVQIVNDLAVTNRQLTQKFLSPPHFGAIHIDKAEAAMLQAQHRNIRCGTHREMSHFLMLDLTRGIPRRARDHIVQRHPYIQKLGHDVQHVLHAGVHAGDVQVGRDRIRDKSLLDRRHCLPKQKTASAMSHIEDHAALPRFEQIRPHFSAVIQHRDGVEISVRGNITGAELLRHQFLIRPLGPELGNPPSLEYWPRSLLPPRAPPASIPARHSARSSRPPRCPCISPLARPWPWRPCLRGSARSCRHPCRVPRYSGTRRPAYETGR